MKAWMSSNFGNLRQSYGPLLRSELSFCSISWKRIDRLRPKFCIHIIIDKTYVGNENHCFRKFATELRPLFDVRIWFLLNILRTNKQIDAKFCIHIIIDKIYVGNLNPCFFAFATELLPLIDFGILFLLNILRTNVVVQLSLCRTRSETPKTGFLITKLILHRCVIVMSWLIIAK